MNSIRLGLLLLLASCGAAPPAAIDAPSDPLSADCLQHALWIRPSQRDEDDDDAAAVIESDDPALEFDRELFRAAMSRSRHEFMFQTVWELQAKFWRYYTVACEDGRRFDLRLAPHSRSFTVVGEGGAWTIDEHDALRWSGEVQRLAFLRDGGDPQQWAAEPDLPEELRSQLETGLQQVLQGDAEPLVALLEDDFSLRWEGDVMSREQVVAWLGEEARSHATLTSDLAPVITSISYILDTLLIEVVLYRPRADVDGFEVVRRFETEWRLRLQDDRYLLVSAATVK